ncbi:hypothetical protein GCM10008018_58570 [Paenibacillus marchantiophytorum]|uniref:Uncharacterized protein n=1 Tax=Paenibacillus marchantiophytorum TaxID=1619310 RepID=A0ABQ1FBW6_9BACL|nr:hypothetical protein [Paenibacillus marchantiophytorum]GGA04954.1 hypothetical protein GCM10008018_58570 [Paenibacillus marchantiophytorum]
MNSILSKNSLSTSELCYLIALIGGKTLPGIEFDGLAEMSLPEVRKFVDQVIRKLEGKSLIQVNFDGTVKIQEDFHTLLSAIAYADRVITQTVGMHGEEFHFQYFLHDNNIVELVRKEQDVYLLQQIWAAHDLLAIIVERKGLTVESQGEEAGADSCTLISYKIQENEIIDVSELSFIKKDSTLLYAQLEADSDGESHKFRLIPIDYDGMMNKLVHYVMDLGVIV